MSTTEPTKRKTRIAGQDLVPDLKRFKAGVSTRHWYWIGIVPQTPVEGIDVAGENFPKVNERVTRGADGTTQRIPQIGAVVALTADKIQKMRDRLPRTVVRFLEPPKATDEPPPRKGHLITIPRAEDLEEARKAGRAVRPYVAQEWDEPAARYMFAVLCTDQKNPRPGDVYPDVLENTGLDWPDEM